MPIAHLEPVLDYTLATLRSNLGAHIDAMNVAHTNFSIDPVPADQISEGVEGTIPSFPWLEVAIPEQFLERPSLGQLHWDARERVILRLWAEAFEQAVLYRTLMRYGNALLRTLLPVGAFFPGSEVLDVATLYRFNPQTNESQETLGGVLQVYSVGTEEILE